MLPFFCFQGSQAIVCSHASFASVVRCLVPCLELFEFSSSSCWRPSAVCLTNHFWQTLAYNCVPHAAGSTPGGSRPTWSAAGRAPPSSIQWWIGILCATPSCTTQLCVSGTASRAAMALSATLGEALPSRAAAVGAPGSPTEFCLFRRQRWSRWDVSQRHLAACSAP